MENTQENNKLSEAIKDHFRLLGKHSGEYHFKGKKIDFRSCSLAEAKKMHELGFPGLEPLKKDTDNGSASADSSNKNKPK